MYRILFIDNSTDHGLYRPLEHWQPLFVHPFEIYHAPLDQPPPEIDRFSHIIISGSLASTLENREWMLGEEDLIRRAVGEGKVILGNCFGHQIIAKALFGNEAVRVREYPEVGWPDMKIIKSDQLLGDEGEIISGFILHFDEVFGLPEEDAEVILTSAECENLAFKLKGYPVWGFQPHFEIGIVQAFTVLELIRGPAVPDKSYFIYSDQRRPRDTGHIIRVMRAFQKTHPMSAKSDGSCCF